MLKTRRLLGAAIFTVIFPKKEWFFQRSGLKQTLEQTLLVLVGFLSLVLPTPLQSEEVPEYSLKSAMTLNILRFIDVSWSGSQIVICGAGGQASKIGFEKLSGRSVGDKEIEIRWSKGFGDTSGCNVLVFTRSMLGSSSSILSSHQGKGKLLVGEQADFCDKGGMIRLFSKDDRIRFELNLESAKESQITFSSKFIRLADIVDKRRQR